MQIEMGKWYIAKCISPELRTIQGNKYYISYWGEVDGMTYVCVYESRRGGLLEITELKRFMVIEKVE